MGAGAGQPGDRGFAEAGRALRADPAIQFDLTPAPPPPRLPHWIETIGHAARVLLRPVGRAIADAVGWVARHMPEAPYARILLWTVLALAAAGLLWLVVARLRSVAWRRRRRPEQTENEAAWRPEAGPARAWLEEAEVLAARGDYAEAVHLLLRRSVEDIARRKPRLIVPSLTARDIAASLGLPATARAIFADIARVVERSLFGGRPVGAEDWTRCRTAYADFALGRTWTA